MSEVVPAMVGALCGACPRSIRGQGASGTLGAFQGSSGCRDARQGARCRVLRYPLPYHVPAPVGGAGNEGKEKKMVQWELVVFDRNSMEEITRKRIGKYRNLYAALYAAEEHMPEGLGKRLPRDMAGERHGDLPVWDDCYAGHDSRHDFVVIVCL